MPIKESSSFKSPDTLNAITSSECVFCSIHNAENNDSWVTNMDYGAVFLNFNQSYYGRLLYIPFDHCSTLHEIPMDIYINYSLEIRSLTEYLQREFNADLINIAMLANKVRHVHWHLIPRYKDDQRWGEAPWPNNEKRLPKKEMNELRDRIRSFLLEK